MFNPHFGSIAAVLVFVTLTACSSTRDSAGSYEVGTKRDGIRCSNGLGVAELAMNAISANRVAVDALISNTLTTSTFATGPWELRAGPHHDRARRFMGYLVSCALRSSQAPVEWDDPWVLGDHATFRGSLGLCPQWATGPFPLPDDCLERVGACVYGARINPEMKRVPISMRGEDPAYALQPTISTDRHLKLSPAFVQSFTPCDGVPGETRNCGWLPSYAGTCTPGTTVAVSAGARRVDTCTDPVLGSVSPPPVQSVLRACSGIYGCDFGFTLPHLGSSPPGQCGDNGPGVVFTCPVTGDFSIMLGPYVSGEANDAVASSDGANAFPGSELDIFSYAEMAVYGNPFQSTKIHREIQNVVVMPSGEVLHADDQNLPIAAGPIFGNMWSCFDRHWTPAQAYLSHRLCGVPGVSNCIANMLGACFRTNPSNSQCNRQNPSAVGGDFEECRDAFNNVWSFPITTYLNQPCDALASGDQDFCRREGDGPEGIAGPRTVANGIVISPLPSSIQAADDGSCDEAF